MDDLNNQLLAAAKCGDTPVCHDLLARGANIHAINSLGINALHLAAGQGHNDTCRLLLERGADVNAGRESALRRATLRGHTHTCRLLLECGADIRQLNRDGWNILHWAAGMDHADTCLLLLEQGGDLMMKVNSDGQTPLDIAIDASNENSVSAMRSWIAANAARAALQEITAAAPPGP